VCPIRALNHLPASNTIVAYGWPMADWNSTGYDVSRSTRWIYAFVSGAERRVKVGLVLTEGRLSGRLREVSRRHPDVVQVAVSQLQDHTHPLGWWANRQIRGCADPSAESSVRASENDRDRAA
jgi:hypothetical protein